MADEKVIPWGSPELGTFAAPPKPKPKKRTPEEEALLQEYLDRYGRVSPLDVGPGLDPLQEKIGQAEKEQLARQRAAKMATRDAALMGDPNASMGGVATLPPELRGREFIERPAGTTLAEVEQGRLPNRFTLRQYSDLGTPAQERVWNKDMVGGPWSEEDKFENPRRAPPSSVLQISAHQAFSAGQQAYERKDFLGAAKAFDAAHKANPSPITALAKARALDHAGSSDEAQKAYMEAVTGHHHPEGAPVLTQEQHDHAERRIMAIGGPRAAQLQRTNSNIRDAALEFARQGHPDPLQAAHHQIYGTGLNADDVARSKLTTPTDKAAPPGVSDTAHRELQIRRDALLNEKTQELARQLAAQGHENALAEAKQLILDRYGSQYVTPTQEKQQVLDLDVRKANQAITEGQRGAAALHYLDAAKIAPEKDKGAFNAARAQQVAEMYDRPEHAEYAWDFAKRAYDEGDYALATQLFMKAYKLNPHPDTHAAAMDSYFKSMSGKERIVPQKVAPEKK